MAHSHDRKRQRGLRDAALLPRTNSANRSHHNWLLLELAPIVLLGNSDVRRDGTAKQLASEPIVCRDAARADGLFKVEVVLAPQICCPAIVDAGGLPGGAAGHQRQNFVRKVEKQW